MTARTVTFAVQLGSGGYDVAHLVAEKLKYRYYDWEVMQRAADAVGLSPEAIAAAERSTSRFQRLFERLAEIGTYDDSVLPPTAESMAAAIRFLSSDEQRKLVERVVTELGELGEAVIVGHAGQMVLGPKSGILKVLIRGSAELRAERLAKETSITKKEATASIEDSDRERLRFFRGVYHADLLDSRLYDLTLNSDCIPTGITADFIVKAASAIPGMVRE